MLFRLSEWNAFAKMRMHTDTTLALFKTSTTIIGRELRSFAATTQAEWKTVELPGETASRARRGTRKKAAGKTPAPPPAGLPTPPPVAKGKFLNLLTYKFHALGDYPSTIPMFGTTDSYSTQTVRPSFFIVLPSSTHRHSGRARSPACQATVWPNEQEGCYKADGSAGETRHPYSQGKARRDRPQPCWLRRGVLLRQ